jgi:hypothetical protein
MTHIAAARQNIFHTFRRGIGRASIMYFALLLQRLRLVLMAR